MKRGALIGMVLALLVGVPLATRETLTAAEASPPPDALAILWADYCQRTEDTRCSTTPQPSATPSPTVSLTPSATPSATTSPKPSSTPSPTPTATATASPTPTSPPSTSPGTFIGPPVAGLPTSGSAWTSLVTQANKTPSVNLADLNSDGDVITLAKALVYARTGDANYRASVISALGKAQASGVSRALELARGLGAYILAADYIGYRDPQFVAWVKAQLTRPVSSGPANLIKCHEQRPQNWGTWCGSSRVIADLYLGDTADLAKAITVWKGYLGDRSAYAGFSYGTLSYQCDSSKPVGINPPCVKSGVDLNGVLPDDQRRQEDGGGPKFPTVVCENYVHEALQGATLALAVLAENGTDLWSASQNALHRAYTWLYAHGCKATGDDTGTPWVVNHYTGASFPTDPANPGKGITAQDWLWR